MAEDKKKEKSEGEAAPAAPVAAGSNSKQAILIGAGVAVLILAIGIPVAFFALKPSEKKEENALSVNAAGKVDESLVAEGAHDEDELLEGEEALGAFYPFETFVVNLAGGRYVRLQVQLEFATRDVPKRFYPRLIPVRDGLINMLAGRTQDDLLNEKGRENLKRDIKDFINETLRSEDVRRVYFTQFVVQ